MDKIRSLISTLLGLLGLVALAVGLSWLFGPQGLRPGQQVLPTQQAMPIQQVSPLRTPTPGKYVEPTAPSEDWPTLTPPPTRVMPTRGTPIVKYVETLTPTPTRPPLALTPVPEGTPPDALQLLYYVADTDAGPELHAIGMDAQGRRWSESIAAYSMPAWDLWGLCLSPDNKYLAAQTAGDGRSVYIIDMSSERVSCLLDEPVGCRGDFYGWTSGGQVLFRPLDAQPGALDAKLGIVLVDFARGQYKEMELPIDSGGYSVANNLTLNAENSKIAYSTTDWGSRESAIWIRDISDGDEQLIHKVAGWIATLSWSPTGEQLLFLSLDFAL
jgi:WD40 repeat protein